ncbi:DUF7144 family membrane protein [Aldersonia kunmingensis]|uniref:DUF7144 family membrane protein n=1 Tax=Aldersonia kunmingensis TaxID=408066 RepID=UPI00082C1F34|nr:hypothetical protein [Aldersonia kunmingensis]
MNEKNPGGWGVFAGLLLIFVGISNGIQGIVALTAPERLFVGEEHLVLLDFDRWGWVLLIWAAILIVAGVGLLAAATWARVFGVTVALLNAIGQLTWLNTQPWLALLLIAIDIGVVWGLTAGWPDQRAEYRPEEQRQP